MKVTTLKGIFPDPKPLKRKNFIHENVKNLRRMEQCFQANKEAEEFQKLQLRKYHGRPIDKYQNVSARVITHFREKKKHEDNNTVSKDNIDLTPTNKVENKEQKAQDEIDILESEHVTASNKIFKTEIDCNISDKQRKPERISKHNKNYSRQKISSLLNVHKFDNVVNNINVQNIVKCKNQGTQTLDTDQMESIYSEGIIRYPSKRITKHDDTVSNVNLNEQGKKVSKLQSYSAANSRGDMYTPEDLRKLDLRNAVSPTHNKEVDFIKLNKEYTSVANKLAMQLNSGALPVHYRKGVVPKYLQDRKEAQQKEQKSKVEMLYPDCPEGHVPLPDDERKETLRLLKKNYQEYVDELNMMPIKTDTLRAQRRKMEIEKQLNKLEEGIKVFSRPKVYVEINA
ncbi:PREDICTED: uncharacterized protein LOC106742187 [Dinoponera quadriceps]|uniref:Uncharacterized protein LOC106742187 n=1 Tax=Dinoponera quadriceps TaxID=609295 RepID=A0A6P3WWA5_DINQU|nr:PREDICTED: uncharacterized protein LOC106742187 [Dinoponera quadriceps]